MRFSKPLPPVKWSGIRDASKFGNECYQRAKPEDTYRVGEEPVDRSEDCLYLNIYKPADTKRSESLAVMVWIHGGSYYLGAGSHYDGSELAATGVIVVTINYRLDVFGFLSNEDDKIPGNYGMLDQILALKWVNKNIDSFGGDPNKVTIFGESAGSGSISLLVISPLATGLFRRAIMESGVSLSPWTFVTPATRMTPRTMLTLIGGSLGCTELDSAKMLACLRKVDATVLMNTSVGIHNLLSTDTIFAPRVEKTYSFLPDLPITMLTRNQFNHVDTIHGFNSDESGAWYIDWENDGISREEFINFLKYDFEPYALGDRNQIIEEILAAYIGNETSRNAMRYAVVRAKSDFQFTGATLIEADIQSKLAKENNHYLYVFNHRPSYSTSPSWVNATHGAEVPFVFGVNNAEFRMFMGDKTPNKEDILVWNQMKSLWSNFAKYGNPTQTVPLGGVNWPYYDTKDHTYLKIDTTSQALSFNSTKAKVIFEKLLQKLQTAYDFDFVRE